MELVGNERLEHRDEIGVVGERAHVRVRPIRSPEHPVGRCSDQGACERRHVVVWRAGPRRHAVGAGDFDPAEWVFEKPQEPLKGGLFDALSGVDACHVIDDERNGERLEECGVAQERGAVDVQQGVPSQRRDAAEGARKRRAVGLGPEERDEVKARPAHARFVQRADRSVIDRIVDERDAGVASFSGAQHVQQEAVVPAVSGRLNEDGMVDVKASAQAFILRETCVGRDVTGLRRQRVAIERTEEMAVRVDRPGGKSHAWRITPQSGLISCRKGHLTMTLGERSRRARIRAALLLALAVVGLCAPSAYAQSFPSSESTLYAAAKKEGTLVWSVGGPLEAMNAIAAEFEKQYPGIKVQTLRLVGVQQYQRFLDETNAQRYFMDVLQNTDYPSMASLIKAGLISEWKIPTINRVPDRFRIADYAYAEYVTTNAIIYNVNKVSPAEIKELETGWQAALDPRFKGRFAVSTMKCGVCYTPIHLFLDPKLKDKYGPAFLDKLAAQGPASYSEVLTSVDRVVAGEQDFTLWGWEGIGATKLQEGAPIRWVFPEPTPSSATRGKESRRMPRTPTPRACSWTGR